MSIGQSLDGAENFIYTLRETSVVLDSDLAKLCKLPLRTLNSAASRHASRFPKDFRFKLTPEEISSLGLKSRKAADEKLAKIINFIISALRLKTPEKNPSQSLVSKKRKKLPASSNELPRLNPPLRRFNRVIL
ncbi:ORF6N domain-containing protein [Candidatus Saccharibacteria bacterium]|nr:ORF6N domain-containing protein [Candidatus Saccharibacteria bacterium]